MKKPTLAIAFEAQLRCLATTRRPSTVQGYRASVRHFLNFLSLRFPSVRHAGQLQRDPHIQGWLEGLWTQRPALSVSCRMQRILHLRLLLSRLAEDDASVALDLIKSSDLPQKDHYLPRPLSQLDDQRLQQELQGREDVLPQALLLMRLTGLRIGELVDLTADCLRELGHEQWSLHVPLGKLHTERWVPVHEPVKTLVQRLRFLARLSGPAGEGAQPFLLRRPHGRASLLVALRTAFREAVHAAGIGSHLVPHQLRHTYATEMLRLGVSFPAVMKLLGHTSPEMTLHYIEITQNDLRREYFEACARPRHIAPGQPVGSHPQTPATLPVLLDSIRELQTSLETVRRDHPAHAVQRKLAKLGNRLAKIAAELRCLVAGEQQA